MTAHELAKKLLAGPDLAVHFSYNYGDHWRTKVAPTVDDVEEKQIVFSGYHNMHRLANEEKDEEGETVIVLS